MTQTPPGWYPDPSPPPGHQPVPRWWDGVRWTDHWAPGPAPAANRQATTTPDGVPLASWWQRVGATLIDGVITTVVTLAVGFPFLVAMVDAFRDYLRQAIERAEAGSTQLPGQLDFYRQTLGPTLGLGAVSLVVVLVYGVGFLKAKGATPGKLALGLRVRLREAPGLLSWATVWKHWLGQYCYLVVGAVPFVGSLGALYSLLDSLWPLWDPNRQAIHDKIAGTNVVVHRG